MVNMLMLKINTVITHNSRQYIQLYITVNPSLGRNEQLNFLMVSSANLFVSLVYHHLGWKRNLPVCTFNKSSLLMKKIIFDIKTMLMLSRLYPCSKLYLALFIMYVIISSSPSKAELIREIRTSHFSCRVC